MSVIVKGMEMPKGCAICPYCDRNWSKPKCHAKSTKGRYMAQKLFLDSRRQDWCPLVDFPLEQGEKIVKVQKKINSTVSWSITIVGTWEDEHGSV